MVTVSIWRKIMWVKVSMVLHNHFRMSLGTCPSVGTRQVRIRVKLHQRDRSWDKVMVSLDLDRETTDIQFLRLRHYKANAQWLTAKTRLHWFRPEQRGDMENPEKCPSSAAMTLLFGLPWTQLLAAWRKCFHTANLSDPHTHTHKHRSAAFEVPLTFW